MTLTPQAVLAELDLRLPETTYSWRSTALRQIVDLFLSGSEFYGREQVALFDAVIERLIQKMDRTDLAELSNKLAPVANAPVKVIGRLARHPDIAVCGPMLEKAKVLADSDIVEIADKDRIDPNVLTKIAQRPCLNTALTDILLKRGNKAMQRSIIDRESAQISEAGFARVIMSLDGDKDLATAIAARDDVPEELRPWLASVLAEEEV
jgi:uncharacterized protein (DUF2336 family)